MPLLGSHEKIDCAEQVVDSISGPAVLGLRRDPRILRIPPYLSALCVVIGVAWLLLLPLNQYSRQTYISENALLPGQVHTYFGGSDHNVFRAYRHEVAALAESTGEESADKLEELLRATGLKVARQKYRYDYARKTINGTNVYAILRGPRADATEAVVLVAAWRNIDGVLNQSGVALILTLARYFKRWSLWSKDIIFVITPDSTAGPQAWVDAYHNAQSSNLVEPLPLKAGALQGAVAIDYPAGVNGHRFDKLHILYDGINGQLPNLDLFNTAVSIASGQMGIECTIQRMWDHKDSYKERLQTMLRGMLHQGLGHGTGPHSSFIPYHVDAITLQTVGDGWHDEMSLGRTLESIIRSLNNLLEHLHQSFFFYLLMQANRFVSIGTYLPSAMLVALNFSIMAVGLWVKSGTPSVPKVRSTERKDEKSPEMVAVEHGGMVAMVPSAMLEIAERSMRLPLALVGGAHLLGLVPLYLFNHSSKRAFALLYLLTVLVTFGLPPLAAKLITSTTTPHPSHLPLLSSFTLLALGLFLSTLATLNFSLSLFIGLLTTPLSFLPLLHSSPAAAMLAYLPLCFISPPMVIALADEWAGVGIVEMATQSAFSWHVWGLWEQVVLWGVWWPAWVLGATALWMGAIGGDGE